jgi:hypothetical protein
MVPGSSRSSPSAGMTRIRFDGFGMAPHLVRHLSHDRTCGSNTPRNSSDYTAVAAGINVFELSPS